MLNMTQLFSARPIQPYIAEIIVHAFYNEQNAPKYGARGSATIRYPARHGDKILEWLAVHRVEDLKFEDDGWGIGPEGIRQDYKRVTFPICRINPS